MLAWFLFALAPLQDTPATPHSTALRCGVDAIALRITPDSERRWTLSELRSASSVSLTEPGFALRVEDSKGKLVAANDGSKGRLPPALLLGASKGTDYVLVATALAADVHATPILRVRCTEESAADRAAIATAKQELIAGLDHERGGRRDALAACIGRASAALLESPPTGASLDRAVVARDLVGLANREGGHPAAESLLRLAAKDAAELLPEFDTTRLGIEQGLVSLLGTIGKFDEAQPILERVWSWRRRVLEDPELAPASTMLAYLRTRAGNRAGAKELYQLVLELVEKRVPAGGFDRHIARVNLAYALRDLGDHAGALALYDRVIEEDAKPLPENDTNAVQVRWDRAYALRALGERDRTREELERILAIAERADPDGGLDVVLAGCEVANTLTAVGLLMEARDVLARTVARADSALPHDHALRLRARSQLAVALKNLGEPRAAMELERQVLATREAALPPEHPEVLAARINLGASLLHLGEHELARELYEDVLAILERTSPDDEETLHGVRQNLASALRGTEEHDRVREIEEGVLEWRLRALPDDHADVQQARQNLASTLLSLGDTGRARALFETVLRIQMQRLPDEHPAVQHARVNLGNALMAAGDFAGARAILERAWAACERLNSADWALRATMRENLGLCLMEQGDAATARAMLEAVLDERIAELPEDALDVLSARANLSAACGRMGDHKRARQEIEAVLSVRESKLPPGHADLEYARINLAAVLEAEGKVSESRALTESVRERLEGSLAHDAGLLQDARRRCAELALRDGDDKRARELTTELARVLNAQWRTLPMTSSPREVGARLEMELPNISWMLSLVERRREKPDEASLARIAFESIETLRGADLIASAVLAASARDGALRGPRDALAAASRRLVHRQREPNVGDDLRDALRARDAAAAELVRALSGRPETMEFTRTPSVETLQDRLEESTALLAYWRYSPTRADGPGLEAVRLVAFVLRRGAPLRSFDLGLESVAAEALQAWRADLFVPIDRGVSVAARNDVVARAVKSGARVRELLVDPLAEALRGAERLVIVPEGALHALPFDALPVEGGVLGERYAIEIRSTARELAWPARAASEGGLLALGGIDFNNPGAPIQESSTTAGDVPTPSTSTSEDSAASATETAQAGERAPDASESTDASGSGLRFRPLTYTRTEVLGIAELFAGTFQTEPRVLTRANASRAALERFAPEARFLHVATHGWVAPDSASARGEPPPPSSIPIVDSEAMVRGLSPMLLAGLALAGANLSLDATGVVEGVVTAEEVATWDLSRCQLAVLSACETHVGVRRAGQGVASLQKALRMAGARNVITSLWKVPDEATETLMLDFYQRYWIEKKPIRRALQEAKLALRSAKDEQGNPQFAARDWAAWVLTGER